MISQILVFKFANKGLKKQILYQKRPFLISKIKFE